MHKKVFSLLIFLFLNSFAFAANTRTDLAVSSIPKSLTNDAYAVVRNDMVTFEYKSPLKGLQRDVKELTILNEKGLDIAHFSVYGDKFRKLKKFSAIMYDKDGNELKKYKMSDVKTTEWSPELITDNLVYYFECEAPTFPFTIVYEYEIEWNKGLLSFPIFAPIDNADLSVQKASYTLSVPVGTEILYEGNSFISKPERRTEKDVDVFQWRLNDLKPIKEEPFSPVVRELIPMLYAMPKSFTYDGHNGSFATINSIGAFQNNLNETRNNLTDEVKQKIITLTQNAKSDKEKVKILYDYLGKNTRYESIQLGIGGFQPATAAEVCKMGFGDCKGLSFYLKSMLDVIGIKSDYTIIRADEDNKALQKDFTCFLRTNHIVLRVPLPKDTLWLECTNTKVPFGYIHEDISGHNAIAVVPGGAEFVKLPDYPDSVNLSKNEVAIDLMPDAQTLIKVKNTNHLKQYEEVLGLTTLKNNEQIDYFRRNINLQKATVDHLNIQEDKSEAPILSFDYDISSSYGIKAGNRYFIPINVFRNNKNNLHKANRKLDIVINNGWQQVDRIEFNIPDGYEIEFLPQPLSIDTPFGSIQSEVKRKDKNKVLVNQRLLIKSGKWNVSTYDAFYDFMDKIGLAYKAEMVLKKI
ncbi:MAG: DUF3857 domain-containing protein [Prevotella sp.]